MTASDLNLAEPFSADATGTVLRLNMPELFAREDFQQWLSRGWNPKSRSPLATWHRGGKPHEYSDVFIPYDHEFTEDISEEVDEILTELWARYAGGAQYGVLWISNLT